MRSPDPSRHSPEGRAVVEFLDAQAARMKNWEARLAAAQERLDRTLADELARVHQAVATQVTEPAESPEAVVEGIVPQPPVPDDSLLSASPFGSEYAAWRSQHIPSQSTGII